MLLNKIVNHGLCFFKFDHAERTITVRASVTRKHERVRPGAFAGRDRAARDVLQFTHSLERTSSSRRAVLAGRVCDPARARVVDLTRTPAAWSKDSRRWLRRGVADRSVPDRARGSGSDIDRVVAEEGGVFA